MIKRKLSLILSLCLCCLLLAGCAEKVKLSAGKYPVEETRHLSAIVTEEDLPLLDGLLYLESADLSGSGCYESIYRWGQKHPEIELQYTVPLPGGGSAANTAAALDLSGMDAVQLENVLALLHHFPALTEIQLPDGLQPEQIAAFRAACPEASVLFSAEVGALSFRQDCKSLDLQAMTSGELTALLPWLPLLEDLSQIELGNDSGELSWDDIAALSAACPEAVLRYDFTLYDRPFSLTDKRMDLNHVEITDEGALVKQIAGCMRNLEYLDMDSCGVSDEAMAQIRDSLPNAEVVWRIWFGDRYSVRTNVERILASNPGMGGELTSENTGSLKYCTKVRYLDLGHNSWLNDVSFLSYMPDLEVCIIAMGNWVDISPLADCPKVEYAELQTSCINDLRPLTKLQNLRHLNLAYCMALTDISPLFEMPGLDRLWLGCLTPVPQEQVDKYRELFPDCEVNKATLDPTEGGWRYERTQFGLMAVPRYDLLREQMNYSLGLDAYSYTFNDPLCY